MSPNWKDLVIEDRISAAANILQWQGNTKKEYEAAESIWFLKWAFQEKYREHRLYGSEKILYEEIYDHSIESDMGEDIDTNAYRSWNSNATSLLAKGENAKVELNFAKHETEILPDIHAARTTVTYEFQNTDTSNQEVIFSVMLPNAASTMIDLRLGVNLEYSGVIAPRGAASHVYEDSLRRNTDPALLEQTGPLTYRLRAYPVPPKTDSVSQWRQRVQFTYVTPLEGDMLSLIPRTDIINLKLTKKSEIVTRVTVWDKSLSQDSKSGDDMTLLTDGKIEKVKSTLGNTYDSYCSLNTYPHIDVTTFKAPTKKLTKNIVFFDISRSVWEKSLVKKQYQSLIDTWKNTGVALDVFTYNTDVYPSGYSLADTDFWWTTDMSKVTDYIDKNNISDTNIVIVTDDNSYEKANSEIKSIDYKKLKSNRISLIQVGKEIRTLKTEITKALLATDGSMIIVDATVPLSDAVKNFFSEKKSNETCTSYSGSAISTLQALQGYEDGKKVFGKNYSYIGYVSRFWEPFRWWLNNPLIKDLMSGSTIDKTSPIYIDVIDFWKSKFYVYKDGVGRDFNDNNSYHNFLSSTKYLKGTTMLTINLPVSAAYFQISDWNGYASQETKLFDTEELKKLIPMTKSTGESVIMSEWEIQEEIWKTSHTINQAVSLIALQNDFQRNQLDQYSQNSDKYDTTYDNLSNAESNSWNRRSGGCGLFGCNKATSDSKSLSIGSQWSSGLLSNSFWWSSWRMTQYIVVIIGFPLIAWFVLRRKPKKVIVVPPAQVTTQDSPK